VAAVVAAWGWDTGVDGPNLAYNLGIALWSLGVAAALSAGVVLALRLASALPLRFRAALAAVVFPVWVLVGPAVLRERLIAASFILVPAAVIGAAATAFSRGRAPPASRRTKALAACAIAAAGYALWWSVTPGVDDDPAVDAAKATPVQVPPLDLPDPGAPGPFAVKRLTYGSGHDRRRPEYAEGAALRTRSVDGSTFFHGGTSPERARYWGFGPHELPIDGRLFYPDAPGPRPVVVLVHGAHPMSEHSEPGYDYLGEHLA
jgi:hypothetical protein